jgi:hypothetical protein
VILKAPVRSATTRILSRIDAWYRRKYRLQPIGPVLLIGCEPYRGSARQFSDGTRLVESQRIGVMHFNNARIAGIGSGTRQRAGVRFARLFRQSLRDLALRAQSDANLKDVVVYHGVTWFKSHGGKVGFESEAITSGFKYWWLASYFRLLAWGFAPLSEKRQNEYEPRKFWITRGELIKHFGGRDGNAG